MIVLWMSSLLAVGAICQQVYEPQTEDERNTTTLYILDKNIKNNFNTTKINNHAEENKSSNNKIKEAATSWKIDAQFGDHDYNIQTDNNETVPKEQTHEKPDKEFKPSPHLETYYEPDVGHYYHALKKPPVGFKFAKDFPRYHNLEVQTKNGWKIAQPITIPAADLYKVPDAFRETDGTGHSLDGEIQNGSQHGVKKKMNPWKGLVRMMTAFLPVGLIISALTPSVVTIQSSGSRSPIKNLHRRSDAAEPRISDQCRRKILCMLRTTEYLHNKKSSGNAGM